MRPGAALVVACQLGLASGIRRAPGALTTRQRFLHTAAASSSLLLVGPNAARAVSGGGKDFSGQSISGEDFSGKKLAGKEFRQVEAIGTNFKGADLRGCSFFKADLQKADFTGANMSGVSLEGAKLEGVILKDARLDGAFFTETVSEVEDLKNADLSDALLPPRSAKLLCERPDVSGKNPATGVDTRESLMCSS